MGCDAAPNKNYVSKTNGIPERQKFVKRVTPVTAPAGLSMCPPLSDKRIAVGPACDRLIMKQVLQLRGIELRYALTMELFLHGPATVPQLIDALAWHGFAARGRPSKCISDALRWEMGYGRVRRLGRGRYGPGWMPRGTEHRIHHRVMALRDRASCRSEAGTTAHAPPPRLL